MAGKVLQRLNISTYQLSSKYYNRPGVEMGLCHLCHEFQLHPGPNSGTVFLGQRQKRLKIPNLEQFDGGLIVLSRTLNLGRAVLVLTLPSQAS